MKTEAEMEGGVTGPRDPLEPPKLEKVQEGPYAGASGGTSVLHHLDLRCMVSRTGGDELLLF